MPARSTGHARRRRSGRCHGAQGVLLPVSPATLSATWSIPGAAAIAAAVKANGVPHVVILSSVGADLPSGTGPIKGFAVTLCIGLVTSVFTAMVVTRLCYDLYPGERRVSQLSI